MVKEYINSAVHMMLYLDEDLELACGSGHLQIVSYCEGTEGALSELTLSKL